MSSRQTPFDEPKKNRKPEPLFTKKDGKKSTILITTHAISIGNLPNMFYFRTIGMIKVRTKRISFIFNIHAVFLSRVPVKV